MHSDLNLIIIHIPPFKKMKVAVVVALLIVASFASSFEEVKAIVKNDKCAESTLEMIRPQIHEQIQNLKQVKNLFYFRTQKTSLPRLNFWLSFKRLKLFSMNAESNKKLNQFSVMPLKLLVLDFYLPQTVSRMSEPFSSLLIQSLKTHLMLPTMLLSSFSSLFWEDKLMPTALNSLTSSSDLFIRFHSLDQFSFF